MALRNKLFADGLYTFALRIVNMLLAAALGIITARALGSHGRGLYAMPMVSAGIVTAGFGGLSSAMSYYLLRRNAGRGVLRASAFATAVFLVIGAGATSLLAFFSHAPWAILPAVLSLPGPAAMMLVTGYATGTHRIRITTSVGVIANILMITLMSLGFYFIGRLPSTAIAVWVISPNLIALASIVWMLRDARSLPSGKVGGWEYVIYAARSGAVGLVSLLNYRADIYIVALLGTPAMLGMYTLAVSASETLLTATQVTNVVTSPHIGSLGDQAAAELAARSVRHNVLVASVCCGLLAIVAPIAVRVLYGDAFTPVVPALRVLLIGVFALSLGSPMSTYFTIRLGRPEVPLTLASASAMICIVMSFILIPKIGLVGAALGSTVAYIFGQTAAIFYFRKVSGISAQTMLVPRPSDLRSYLEVASSFLRRKRTVDSRV